MNIFRLLGDLSHLASFFFLLKTLRERRNAAGISLKTQELYLIVFAARYLDLFTNFYSLYNSAMKVVYLAASGAIVWMLRTQVRACGGGRARWEGRGGGGGDAGLLARRICASRRPRGRGFL